VEKPEEQEEQMDHDKEAHVHNKEIDPEEETVPINPNPELIEEDDIEEETVRINPDFEEIESPIIEPSESDLNAVDESDINPIIESSRTDWNAVDESKTDPEYIPVRIAEPTEFNWLWLLSLIPIILGSVLGLSYLLNKKSITLGSNITEPSLNKLDDSYLPEDNEPKPSIF
jgi:hypothetical protein